MIYELLHVGPVPGGSRQQLCKARSTQKAARPELLLILKLEPATNALGRAQPKPSDGSWGPVVGARVTMLAFMFPSARLPEGFTGESAEQAVDQVLGGASAGRGATWS